MMNTTPSFLITKYSLQTEYNKTDVKKILLDYFLKNFYFKLTFKKNRIFIEVDNYGYSLNNDPVYDFNMYDQGGNLIQAKKCFISQSISYLAPKDFDRSLINYIIREIKQKLICDFWKNIRGGY